MSLPAIILGLLLLAILALLALGGRVPAEERNCPCEGCKILRERRMPKAKSLRDRLAEAHSRENAELRARQEARND